VKDKTQIDTLVAEYHTLLSDAKKRTLSLDESRRLETLKETVLNAAALTNSKAGFPPRQPRAPVTLEVRFRNREDAGKAVARDISTGGMSIEAGRSLPKGTVLHLQVQIPGWQDPILVDGEVVWTTATSMGIAFQDLPPQEEQRLKQLVLESGSILTSLSAVFGKKPRPAPATVLGGASIALNIGDEFLSDVTAELLGLHGYAVYDSFDASVDLLVTDPLRLADSIASAPNRPVIVINASGPDSLVGGLSGFRPAAWVPRPANAARIVEAVRRMVTTVPRIIRPKAAARSYGRFGNSTKPH
jgi:uncharacterized protein (TIGR02266 family)